MQTLVHQAVRLVPIAIPILFGFVLLVAGSTVLILGWRASRIPSGSTDARPAR